MDSAEPPNAGFWEYPLPRTPLPRHCGAFQYLTRFLKGTSETWRIVSVTFKYLGKLVHGK